MVHGIVACQAESSPYVAQFASYFLKIGTLTSSEGRAMLTLMRSLNRGNGERTHCKQHVLIYRNDR